MKNKKEFCCCCSALILWGAGALFLLLLWKYQKSLSDPLGAYIQFTLMFVATFYVLALFPIKQCLNRLFQSIGTAAELPGPPSH